MNLGKQVSNFSTNANFNSINVKNVEGFFMSESKKCKPLKCKTFSKVAVQFETRQPIDVIVVNCPFRTPKCECVNQKETLVTPTY
jgi:hypothetical protein